MKRRSAQYAYSRLPARALALAVVACAALLICAAPALAGPPTATIDGVPPLNRTFGTFSFTVGGDVLKVECKLDSSEFGPCSSPLELFGLTAGWHTFTLQVTGKGDYAGFIATAPYPWKIDLVPPEPPLIYAPAANLITNDALPVFSGDAEPGVRVAILRLDSNDQSTQIGNPKADVNGHWTFTPPAPLADGVRRWYAYATDPSGNQSDSTTPRSLTIDTQLPAAPTVISPAAAAKVNTRTPTVSGTTEPAARISVSEGAAQLCQTVADSSGAWACGSTSELPDGSHTIDVVARDAAGNESAPTTRSFELDATPPDAPTVTAPDHDFATQAFNITVSGTASPLAMVEVLTGNPSTPAAFVTAENDGSWSKTFAGLAEYDYVFSANEIDDFDNRSAPSNVVHVRIDRTPPTVTVTKGPASRTNKTSASFKLSADELVVDYECALDGDDWQPCTDSPDFSPLNEATHSFKARATDSAGNVGQASAIFSWTVDTTEPPAPSIGSPSANETVNSDRPTFSGTAEPGSSVEVFVGGDAVGAAPADETTGNWTLAPAAALPQGAVTAKAHATDVAGNVGPFSAERLFTVDSVPPVTTITAAPVKPTSADTVKIGFSASELPATFECSLDSTTAFAACTSPYTTVQLTEGSHTLRVRATDAAGNVEDPAALVTVHVDRTAPVGQSALIAGSAGSDGVPWFSIASDDPGATAQCKLDNGAFVSCGGQFKPVAAAGLHALTVRFTDAAGNARDQVIAFSVTPVRPSQEIYYQSPPVKHCKVLGVDGRTTGRLKITSVAGSGRKLKLKLRAGAAAVVRVDVRSGKLSFGSFPLAIKSHNSRIVVKLKRTPKRGAGLALTVRFYSVKREYGTARLALTVGRSGARRAKGAQSTLDTECPAVRGHSSRTKLSLRSASTGARNFVLRAKGRRPGLIALKVHRSGSSTAVVDQLVALAAGRQNVKVKLLAKRKLARGRYKLTFDELSADGKLSRGRGSFRVR